MNKFSSTGRTLFAALILLPALSLVDGLAGRVYAADGGAILVTAVSGSVEMQEGPDQAWKATAAGAEIREGHMLRTGPDGRAQVTFPDKAVVWIKESSSFGMQSTLPLTRKVKLEQGEVKISVPHLKRKQTFEVHTANAVAAVRGTVFTVKSDASGNLDIRVAFGEVKVHLVAEAKTYSVPQGSSFERSEGATAKVSLMTSALEEELLIDWSPGLLEDQRDDALDQNEADRQSIQEFARTTEAQQDSINGLVQQAKDEDFAAGRTLVDAHGNLTRVDQRLLRPTADTLQFINLVKRPNYQYRDHGPAKPWTNTQGAVTDRLDSLQAFVTFNKELPQDLVEWPSFFSDNDVEMKSADMVMTNQTDPTNILVIGSFGTNCKYNPTDPTCAAAIADDPADADEIVGGFYVGSVSSVSDIRDKDKLLRASELDGIQDYSVNGEADGVLFSHGAKGLCVPDCTTGGHEHLWLTSESYVIDNAGEVKKVDDFVKSDKDPFSLLRDTAGQLIFSIKGTTSNGELLNPGGSSPNIAGDVNITKVNEAGYTAKLDSRNKNIDLVLIPDLAVTIVQKLASSLSEADSGDDSNN